MKKYLHIAKQVKPALGEDASAAIAEHYSKLRSFEQDQHDQVARVGSIELIP